MLGTGPGTRKEKEGERDGIRGRISSIMLFSHQFLVMLMLQAIYHAFGGSQKGLYFKQLLTGLVAIAYGTKDEKAKCKKSETVL